MGNSVWPPPPERTVVHFVPPGQRHNPGVEAERHRLRPEAAEALHGDVMKLHRRRVRPRACRRGRGIAVRRRSPLAPLQDRDRVLSQLPLEGLLSCNTRCAVDALMHELHAYMMHMHADVRVCLDRHTLELQLDRQIDGLNMCSASVVGPRDHPLEA